MENTHKKLLLKEYNKHITNNYKFIVSEILQQFSIEQNNNVIWKTESRNEYKEVLHKMSEYLDVFTLEECLFYLWYSKKIK